MPRRRDTRATIRKLFAVAAIFLVLLRFSGIVGIPLVEIAVIMLAFAVIV